MLLTIAGTLEKPATGEVLVVGHAVAGMARDARARLRIRPATALASASHEDGTMNETTGGRRRWRRTPAASPVEFRLDGAILPAGLTRGRRRMPDA